MEFSLGAVPIKRPSSAPVSCEEGGPSSPPPFAESSRQRSAETAERIRKASAPSSVILHTRLSSVRALYLQCFKGCSA